MRKLAIALLLSLSAFAQYETATVLGTVTDPRGAAVSGVKVTLENTQTGVKQVATSDSAGDYTFLNLRIGTFRVLAESPGFKQTLSDPFTLTVGARQRVNLALQVGEVTQS